MARMLALRYPVNILKSNLLKQFWQGYFWAARFVNNAQTQSVVQAILLKSIVHMLRD